MFTKIFLTLVILVAGVVTFVIMPIVSALAHENRESEEFQFIAGFLEEPAYENAPNAAFLRINNADSQHDDEAVLYEQGALFNAIIQPEDSFIYTVPEGVANVKVFFHAEGIAREPEGQMMIEHSEHVEPVRVDITMDGFVPSELTVSEGAEITFHNATSQSATLINNTVPESQTEDINLHTKLEVEITHISTGERAVFSMQPSVNGAANEFIAPFIPTALGAYQFRFFGEVDGEPVDEIFKGGPGTFDEVISPRTIQFPFEVASGRELVNSAAGTREIAEDARSLAQSPDAITWAAFAIGIVGFVAGIAGIVVATYMAKKLKA